MAAVCALPRAGRAVPLREARAWHARAWEPRTYLLRRCLSLLPLPPLAMLLPPLPWALLPPPPPPPRAAVAAAAAATLTFSAHHCHGGNGCGGDEAQAHIPQAALKPPLQVCGVIGRPLLETVLEQRTEPIHPAVQAQPNGDRRRRRDQGDGGKRLPLPLHACTHVLHVMHAATTNKQCVFAVHDDDSRLGPR